MPALPPRIRLANRLRDVSVPRLHRDANRPFLRYKHAPRLRRARIRDHLHVSRQKSRRGGRRQRTLHPQHDIVPGSVLKVLPFVQSPVKNIALRGKTAVTNPCRRGITTTDISDRRTGKPVSRRIDRRRRRPRLVQLPVKLGKVLRRMIAARERHHIRQQVCRRQRPGEQRGLADFTVEIPFRMARAVIAVPSRPDHQIIDFSSESGSRVLL